MKSVKDLLNLRLKKAENPSKTAALAKQSANGNLSGFSGIFSVAELPEKDKASIEAILERYNTGNQDLEEDLQNLCALTSEVQAINNQAAILHGERIKKAQTILKSYQEGAFTAWLIETYGNRQTPYNLLQYFEFYSSMPQKLRPQIESMPRQAVYTLASREGELEEKQQIVADYQGETKNELLALIRERFPLDENDRRRPNVGENAISLMKKLALLVGKNSDRINDQQKEMLLELIEAVTVHIDSK